MAATSTVILHAGFTALNFSNRERLIFAGPRKAWLDVVKIKPGRSSQQILYSHAAAIYLYRQKRPLPGSKQVKDQDWGAHATMWE